MLEGRAKTAEVVIIKFQLIQTEFSDFLLTLLTAWVCEHDRSRHKEVVQNEKPPQNQKGTACLSTDVPVF